MVTANLEELTVYSVDRRNFVRSPEGRGEELLVHLASHGVGSRLRMITDGPFDQLEILGHVDPVIIQAILDEWER